jgi:membrane protein implicated in regulation of membrane protease activity
MRRHRLDPVSLIAGLACIALAVAALTSTLALGDLDRGLVLPCVLIVVAVLLIAGIRTNVRESGQDDAGQDDAGQRRPVDTG